jgi:hypothetical protein
MTDAALFKMTEHAAVPEHAPVHPVKVEPTAGVAERMMRVFAAAVSEQSVPQAIP